VKVLHSICQQIWKTQQWPQDWKMLVFISIPKKGNAKECSNYHTVALISHTSKVILKILQPKLQQYVNRELLDVQAGFRKGRGTQDQIANICWIIDKAREFQKIIYFCFCYVHTISVLNYAHLCMKYSLAVSNFLEEIFSLSRSIVFLYFFALITEEGFLISPC